MLESDFFQVICVEIQMLRNKEASNLNDIPESSSVSPTCKIKNQKESVRTVCYCEQY